MLFEDVLVIEVDVVEVGVVGVIGWVLGDVCFCLDVWMVMF